MIVAWAVATLMLMAIPGTVSAGHNPPRPLVSYNCSRYALKFNAKTDRWECAPGTQNSLSKDTANRLREQRRAVEARIRELQKTSIENQLKNAQRLQQLINQQRELSRMLQRN